MILPIKKELTDKAVNSIDNPIPLESLSEKTVIYRGLKEKESQKKK